VRECTRQDEIVAAVVHEIVVGVLVKTPQAAIELMRKASRVGLSTLGDAWELRFQISSWGSITVPISYRLAQIAQQIISEMASRED